MSLVLVTGGSGFVAGHCILELLRGGLTVRATVRDPAKGDRVRATLAAAGAAPEALAGRLSFVAADLEKDDGWDAAAAGCDYVMHVASPFPAATPEHEDDLIRPAREGTLRVLKAAHAAGVKRAVVTSSFAAVGYGHAPREAPFDETSWTDITGKGVSAYVKSKTLAERAAWEFAEREMLELATVNPVGVFGPVLGKDFATSVMIVQRMLQGKLPGVPKAMFGAVDVRDVADLHLRAMVDPAAAGQRFLAVGGDFGWIVDYAKLLKERLGPAAAKVPTRQLPSWLVRIVALFDREARQIVPELGRAKNATSDKAKRLLGWAPRSAGDAVVASAESLVKNGLV